MTHYERCPFCTGSIRLHWPEALVWRCTACDLRFRNPAPSEGDLDALYEKSWADPETHRAETGGTDLRLARVYARKLLRDLGQSSFRDRRILEFGAGTGAMGVALSEHDADVFLVEPYGHEQLATSGLQAYRSLDDLPPGVMFDGIVCMDVVEHLLTPWETLGDLNRFLRPSGWIYLSTLNAVSLPALLGRSHWREVRKLGHLVFPTPRSLEAVLERAGYAQYRRPRWFVRYSDSPIRRAVHYALQSSRRESSLRYLAAKES